MDDWAPTFHVADPLDPAPPAKHEQGRDGRCHLCDKPWPCRAPSGEVCAGMEYRNPYCSKVACLCHEFTTLRQKDAVFDAALYLRGHWPAYWIVLDSWPAELRNAVEVLRGASQDKERGA